MGYQNVILEKRLILSKRAIIILEGMMNYE